MSKPSTQLPMFTHTPTRKPTIQIYCDGAARGNPGPAGIGIAIMHKGQLLVKAGFALGTKTNNQAEYLAFIIALLMAQEHCAKADHLEIHSDSELLVQQMNGNYRVRNPALQKLFAVAYLLSKQLPISISHVQREANTIADALANHGIDTQTLIPKKYKQVLHEYQLTV